MGAVGPHGCSGAAWVQWGRILAVALYVLWQF